MSKKTLTIEAHHSGRWHSVADMDVFEPERGVKSRVRIGYRDEYITRLIDDLDTRDNRAIAEHYPVGFDVWTTDHWPPFLYDIVPSGAARRWWRQQLAASFETEQQLDWLLLRNHTIAPIGHLRIATQPADQVARPFTRADVIVRDQGFLEYVRSRGAAIGGATGAGGDAPKILLAESTDSDVYPAATIPDDQTARCWFVKWPRGSDTTADRIVLRTEYHYAHALEELGLDVCPGTLETGPDVKPSLWLPRFDRKPTAEGLERIAVESLYSLAQVASPGARGRHQSYLRSVYRALEHRDQADDFPALAREYVCRDFLDVVLGNSDNHGRNRALVRGERLQWAPIYDLAPMVLDPAGITRSTVWETHEYAGDIDWSGVCEELDSWIPNLGLAEHLRAFADRLRALPDLLVDRGVDEAVMNAPRIYLAHYEETIERWGLR